MVKKKKLKDDFKSFRHNEKASFQTIKTTLKSILCNHNEIQPEINNLVFAMNDLMIHSYQYIRLYVLHCYSNQLSLPEIDETFIIYCIKALGVRDNRGKKSADTELLEKLDKFYQEEYQPLLNHEKTNLKNTTFISWILLVWLVYSVLKRIKMEIKQRRVDWN